MTLSIITICFNNLQELITTCRSVDEQTVLPNEHIIIDGSTNEEIVTWLRQQAQPAYRHFIHERDKGISDAFNKGITRASGELTHLLNSGDRYAGNTTLETVLGVFKQDRSLMWTHSQYIQHRGDVDVISGSPFEKNKLWKGMRMVAHPSMFIKKEVYERHGIYDTNYKIAMDYDMLVRMRNEKFCFIPSPLVYFAPGGASGTHFTKGLKEIRRSHAAHIGTSVKQVLWQCRQRTLHLFMQTAAGKIWFQWKNRAKTIKKSTT